MKITTVLIDIDNTIIDFNESAKLAINKVALKNNIILPDNYLSVFLEINDLLWSKFEKGQFTKQNIYDNRWNMIFSKLEISYNGPAFEEDFRNEMKTTAVAVKDAREILRYLSKKYNVYAASNASKKQQEMRIKMLGFDKYLSGFFTSEELGYQKPQKGFFEKCLEKLFPAEKENMIMIGDNIEADIIGAADCGIKTIWFNFQKSENISDCADFCVNNLIEIKEIL